MNTSVTRCDRDLVARCNQGDETAWTELYRAYQHLVYRITHWRRWGLSPAEADEVMQEVFLSLVNSLPDFDFRSSLETYIGHIAANKCVSALRKRLAERAGGQVGHLPIDKVVGVVAGADDPPDLSLLQKEQQEILHEGVRSLGLPCRSVLRFRFVDGFSYQEIAVLLGVEEGTVGSRLSRCISELREICERLCNSTGKKFLRVATTP